jgi:membrane fusion protein, copper/silver efflux system
MNLHRSSCSPITLVICIAASLILGCTRGSPAGESQQSASAGEQAAAGSPTPLYYRHPMHPEITSPTPAKDEMGMDYVPVYATGAASGEVRLSAAVEQKLGVRTAPVMVGPLPLDLRAPGSIRYDERTVAETYVPLAGRIEKLSVHSVGETVRLGQLLFELYSPALATVDEQYLRAASPGATVDNPYFAGLRALGLTDDLIADLREHRRSAGRIPFRASGLGALTGLNVREGAFIAQGASALQWAKMDPVWAVVDVPASLADALRTGTSASVTVAALPGQTFSGPIDYVYPVVDAQTRAVQARVVLANHSGVLKPNMMVSVAIEGPATGPVLHVPREAVIRDGRSDRVVVALGNGRFVSRQVRLGRENGERVVVLEGLSATDQVVTSGLFLIDSEANIRSGLARMSESPPQPDRKTATAAGNP